MCWTASIKPNFTDISIFLVYWLSCLYIQNVIGSYRINIFLFCFIWTTRVFFFLSLSLTLSRCVCVLKGTVDLEREEGEECEENMEVFDDSSSSPSGTLRNYPLTCKVLYSYKVQTANTRRAHTPAHVRCLQLPAQPQRDKTQPITCIQCRMYWKCESAINNYDFSI